MKETESLSPEDYQAKMSELLPGINKNMASIVTICTILFRPKL